MKKLLLLSLVLLCGCKKVFLGEEPSPAPEQVFETLWNDFDTHYALFGLKGIDWDSLYAVYRPRVTSETSEQELWFVLCDMLENLEDTHVVLFQPEEPYWQFDSNWRKRTEREYYPEAVERLLSSPPPSVNPYLQWGEIRERGIGYIFVENFRDTSYPVEDMDKLIAQVAHHRAIIVDVRDNGGGVASHAWRLSSWFSDNTDNVLYTQKRNGPGHQDFGPKREHRNFLRDDNLSATPVILLTDNRTASAGEWFALSMKTFANVVHIGGVTSGGYSTKSMDRFLPNGWMYYYSIEKITLPDGTSPEGVGCIPDIIVHNDPDDLYTDYIMLRTLEYLKERYGI